MTTTFESAKVGDKVWSIDRGWGVIQSLDGGDTYPIIVEFQDERTITFMIDGKRLTTNKCQTLFWDEIEVNAPAKPLPDLEVDAKVIVWTDPAKKYRRHFSHFSDGHVCTFDAGATSFSMLHKNSITCWPHWEVAE